MKLSINNKLGNIVNDGLVLYLDAGIQGSYPGSPETTWTDLAGSNNGTLTNGPTYDSANGGSIVFDGINDYAEIVTPVGLQSQNLTVSLWVKPNTQAKRVVSLFDYDHSISPFRNWVIQSEDADTNRYYYFAYYDGVAFQPAGYYGVGQGIQLTLNVWQNIAFTKSGTAIVGYKNAVPVYTPTAANGTVSYATRNLGIAECINSSFSREFNGNVVTTKVYNRALSASEINQNFQATRGRFGI